jgi:hypothetical protein
VPNDQDRILAHDANPTDSAFCSSLTSRWPFLGSNRTGRAIENTGGIPLVGYLASPKQCSIGRELSSLAERGHGWTRE